MKNLQYRNEYKYVISIHDKIILEKRLSAFLKKDKNVNEKGYYFIRSLYFDTHENKALIDKLDGVSHRNKYRIRYYDFNTDFIRLENKIKDYGSTLKPYAPITKDEVENVLNGNYTFLKDSSNPLMREFYIQLSSGGLVPRTIVDYNRVPFVHKHGNVRITLDSDIRAPVGVHDFFSKDKPTYSVLPPGSCVLEVKFDSFIPEFIRDIIQVPETRETALSKYLLCRLFI